MRIGNQVIGSGHPCAMIAEIGINHNGDVDRACKMIAIAAEAGCQFVKFQKRTPEICWPASKWTEPPKWTQSGCATEGEWKEKLEFTFEEFRRIDACCREHCIEWFASCWDDLSVDFIEEFDPPAYKIASACLTDHDLLRHTRATGRPIILSTGMSTLEEIDAAVEVLGTDSLCIMQCTATYPCNDNELNLNCIRTLKDRYDVPVGYSGHEKGLATTVAAVALGACIVERHVTLDRADWGSDQSASIEPPGLKRLVRDIRAVEAAMGDGVKQVYESEIPSREKLRRKHARV